MANHPHRSTVKGKLAVKRQDATWAPAGAEIEDYLRRLGLKAGLGGITDTARGVLAASYYGYAVRGENGRARTVIEFSGDTYDAWIAGEDIPAPTSESEGPEAVLRAFINPRDGSVDRNALRQAALLYLNAQSR